MQGDFPDFSQSAQAQMGQIGNIYGGTYQQCSTCQQWHYGYHLCPHFQGTVSWITSPPSLTVADVERVVAKALEEHSKKYLAIIEKLADALAGKK